MILKCLVQGMGENVSALIEGEPSLQTQPYTIIPFICPPETCKFFINQGKIFQWPH